MEALTPAKGHDGTGHGTATTFLLQHPTSMNPQEGNPRIDGIHHVTAIASDPQPNLDFFVRFLGLRLVKRTVNFDDPGTYHFYYGDETGAPGSILTFFPWPGARRGRHGTGQVTSTGFAVGAGSLPYWEDRAHRYGVQASSAPGRFGEAALNLSDGDGLAIELIASTAGESQLAEDSADIPAEHAVRRIRTATLAEVDAGKTVELLTGVMGFRETVQDGHHRRFEAGASAVDVLVETGSPRGAGGAGTVHHIAFRTPDGDQQLQWHSELTRLGYQVSPVMDRNYFTSIYFREPGGILFEIATDGPGFTVDEPVATLGTELKLPPEYEGMRERLEKALPPITVPISGLLTESY